MGLDEWQTDESFSVRGWEREEHAGLKTGRLELLQKNEGTESQHLEGCGRYVNSTTCEHTIWRILGG